MSDSQTNDNSDMCGGPKLPAISAKSNLLNIILKMAF